MRRKARRNAAREAAAAAGMTVNAFLLSRAEGEWAEAAEEVYFESGEKEGEVFVEEEAAPAGETGEEGEEEVGEEEEAFTSELDGDAWEAFEEE